LTLSLLFLLLKDLPVILPNFSFLCSWPGWIYVSFFQDLVAYQENCKKALSLIERNSQSILQCVASSEVLQHFHQSTFQKKVTQVQITFQVITLHFGAYFWNLTHMQLIHIPKSTFHCSVALLVTSGQGLSVFFHPWAPTPFFISPDFLAFTNYLLLYSYTFPLHKAWKTESLAVAVTSLGLCVFSENAVDSEDKVANIYIHFLM